MPFSSKTALIRFICFYIYRYQFIKNISIFEINYDYLNPNNTIVNIGKTLNRYTNQRDQITANINALNTSDSEYMGLVENAFHQLENFKQTYINSPLAHKQKLISSIFPEKIEFYGKNVELLAVSYTHLTLPTKA